MYILVFIVVAWLIHAAVACVASAPTVYFSRKRVDWQASTFLILLIPFALWFAFIGFSGVRPKSFSNFVIEPAIVAIAIPIALFIRALAGPRVSESMSMMSMIAVVSAAAVWVYLAIPCLPE